MSACDDLASRCGTTYDCARLCRELRAESLGDGELACPERFFGPFVECVANDDASCADTCEREAVELGNCNAMFCAVLPDAEGCALPPLITECGPDSTALPEFDRACTASGSTCALFFHQSDCCGTTVAMAHAAGVARQVQAAEDMCRSMIPDCDCPAGPLTDENGTLVGPGDTVSARCVDGTCRALVE